MFRSSVTANIQLVQISQSCLYMFQGQFLLENIVDRDQKYEFPLELEVKL